MLSNLDVHDMPDNSPSLEPLQDEAGRDVEFDVAVKQMMRTSEGMLNKISMLESGLEGKRLTGRLNDRLATGESMMQISTEYRFPHCLSTMFDGMLTSQARLY